MPNLFFIHTPLQLMIAQQIISQEDLQDNVMLYGYVDDNKHFLEQYELTVIDDMWKAKVPMPQVSRWAVISRKRLLKDSIITYNNYNYIKKVIIGNHVDTLFLGDMWNMSCQLAAMSFHCKGLKICFFEEGAGHYIKPFNYGKGGNFIDKIYALIIDVLYYRPFYKVSYGYVLYWKGITYNDMPMDERYSIVPFYHEAFDKQVTVMPLFSDKLNAFIKKEVVAINQNENILLLTSPCYINGIDDNPQPYIETIIDYLKSLDSHINVHIKFHPRETVDVRNKIKQELEGNKIKYILLGEKINIPVEYYLQHLKYKMVVMFITSTAYYNGYLFPKTVFVSLLENYYIKCKAIGSVNTQYLEPLLLENSWK